jgi:hypothetical protein
MQLSWPSEVVWGDDWNRLRSGFQAAGEPVLVAMGP